MDRIATTTVAADLFGAGKDGFTSGNPNSQIAPTQLSAAWCNGVQEELVRCIEFSGQTPEEADRTQLIKSLPHSAHVAFDPDADDVIFPLQSEAEPSVPGSGYYQKTDTATTSSDMFADMCFFTPPDGSAGSVKYTIVACLVGTPSTTDTLVIQNRWKKTLGVTAEISSWVTLYGGVLFDWYWEMGLTAGSISLKLKPMLGEDPDQDYNISVVGEFFVVKA